LFIDEELMAEPGVVRSEELPRFIVPEFDEFAEFIVPDELTVELLDG
jgi:hypothetical protein